MIILPAIDIKDGNCVRLFKGDFSTVEKVAADYMETAKGFEAAGASWIHMVDLDGAKEGRPVNQHIYEDVAAKTGLKVEVGGGIRNLETIDTYLKSGVERVILGSAALKNPQLVKDAANAGKVLKSSGRSPALLSQISGKKTSGHDRILSGSPACGVYKGVLSVE